jgi:hypothetical protein
MDINEFKRDRIEFLAKLCESCNYNTTSGADAFEIGRQLQFDDDKTIRIVNYLLEKKFIRKSKFDIPINTGDPPPQRNSLLVFITSDGIDKIDKTEPKTVSSIHHYHGDTYQTDIGKIEYSNIHIDDLESVHTINITEAKNKELVNIVAQLKNNTIDLPPELKNEIQSDIVKLENEFSSDVPDKNRVVRAMRSLYNKTKDSSPLIGIAIQIANWLKPA